MQLISVSKYVKQTDTTEGKINKSMLIVGDFKTHPLIIDRSS